MITNPADYQQLLYQLEDENFPIKYPSLPSPEDEALIKINLQTKKIENTNNYVTIEGDHAAETLYFEVNRYHGLVDLSNMMCIVSYINADNEKRIYPVPYYVKYVHILAYTRAALLFQNARIQEQIFSFQHPPKILHTIAGMKNRLPIATRPPRN